MVSTLTRIFGLDNIDLAEDVVQDAMVKALQQWSFGSIPENPSGWIMQVAKNRTLDILRRQKLFQSKEKHVVRELENRTQSGQVELFAESEIKDDQLRMIFACCHPALSRESQIALTLKTLCGLGVCEIARSFLTSQETIAKRLTRAKQQLREAKVPFEIPSGRELASRLDSVLQIIYLLFNEGYNASQGAGFIRWDLCTEAIRLSELVLEHPRGNTPKSNALHALMLFHAARFPARVADDGGILLLQEQDRSRWNRSLIEWGLYYLDQSAAGDELSRYHLQAGISACHSLARSYDETDWSRILTLYDLLIQNDASPIVALNRAVAISRVHGPEVALRNLEEIKNRGSIDSYYLLHAIMGEFNLQLGNLEPALVQLRKALGLTSVHSEKRFLEKKISLCEAKLSPKEVRFDLLQS